MLVSTGSLSSHRPAPLGGARRRLFAAVALCAWLVSAGGCGGGGGGETSSNQPPELTLDVGSEETYIVGEDVIQIRLSATDPEGDELSFEVADKPERAEFTTYQRRAYFRWDPIASDVTMDDPRRLTFIARDEHGNRTDRVVRVHIEPGNGQPSFRPTTSSVSYNTNSGEPVEFEVEVRDDDSEQVDLTMPPADSPQGAEFDQESPKSGVFRWEPTPVQKETRVHSVTFRADDGDNPTVEHEVKILFKDQRPEVGPGDPQNYQQDCETERPIEHEALGAQHTIEDYSIEATLSESAAETFDLAGVLWTREDAFNRGADVSFNTENLEIDGREISGSIPNLQLASGESSTIHYQICAIDEDAPSDSPEAFVCSPSADSLYHSFLAYSPDDATCLDDSPQPDNFESAAEISADAWKHFRLCPETPDVHRFEVEAGTTGYAFFAFPLGQPIDFQVFDADRQPVDGDALQVSNCAGLARVAFDHSSADDSAEYFVQVTGEDIPYQTRFASETPDSSESCEPDAEEPNDSSDEASLLIEDQVVSDLTICEGDTDVFLLELYQGDVFGTDLLYDSDRESLEARLLGPEATVERGADGLARHISNDSGETLVHNASETGNYHLLVYSEDPPASYDLDFETTCRDTDRFEGNASREQAAEPDFGLHDNLKLCGHKADWFRLEATEGNYTGAEVTARRGPPVDQYSLTAYDADGEELSGDRNTTDDSRQLGFTPASDGPRYFEITAPSAAIYSVEFAETE